jgi:hypothetical protein
MTLARTVAVLICLLATPAWAARKAGPCLITPSLEAIDAALTEVVLSAHDADRVLRLRGAVSHHLARNEHAPARAALTEVMALLGYTYVQEEPKSRNSRACPPGAWQRQP